MPRQRPRISFISLGCAKNLVDAEVALARILSAGFDLAIEPADADLVIINTCAFIAAAREESRAAIAAALDLRPQGERRPAVAVAGCYSICDADELERLFPDLDGIIGLAERDLTPQVCRCLLAGKRVRAISASGQEQAAGAEDFSTPRPRLLLTPPSYAYLKIAEGCDNRCAYCRIPQI
ncbi:MAG: 30S ribosomal protein S12 methylthiotransferase RimO, partial [Planctomycetota bacterium]|nr:30S ribosomal protein S12 methylthiotransferase RimO [Planctomycetota bacterium]